MQAFRYTWRTFSRELVLLFAAVLFCVPGYFVATLSLKTVGDVIQNPLAFPTDPDFSNYRIALEGGGDTSLARALINSAIITLGSVGGLIALGSVCAYTLVRRPSKLSTATYSLFVLGIILPLQLGIVPLFVAMRDVGLAGTYVGMIIVNIGVLMPLTVILYTGFVRVMPKEYEEAAQVDGAGLARTFVRVVFPLLRPVTGTVAVLTAVLTWNEFFLPLILLSGSANQTLPVAIYGFVGEYFTQWNYVFAAVGLAVVPMLLFFGVAQRQLVRGFTGGIRG
jgi:raffinose/stachyose/melibiose transport system permease protein